MADGPASVEDLSLCGLLGRLELLERYGQIRSPTDEEAAALAGEGAVKKAVAERAFLEAQIKAVDPQAAASEKRAARLKELLASVSEAASAEEPPHVQRARADLKRAEKDFAEVNKKFEKWDKGKQMLSIDEIKSLKRSHEEAQKRLDAARSFVEEQLARRAEAAAERPKALEAKVSRPVPVEFRPGPPKAAGRGPAPAVHVRPAAGGGGGYPAPAALRQGWVAAEVRAELAAELVAEDAGRPRPKPPPAAVARPRPARPSGGEEDGPVLSFGCACRAVAEYLGIGEGDARAMAESSKDFQAKLDAQGWEWVQERAVAIEKADREEQREKEKRRQAAAVARNTAKTGGSAPAAVAPPARAAAAAAPKVPGAKGKAKPKPAAAKNSGLAGLAGANRFGGLGGDDDSDEDGGGGWSTVRRSFRPAADRYIRARGRPRTEWIRTVLPDGLRVAGGFQLLADAAIDAQHWRKVVKGCQHPPAYWKNIFNSVVEVTSRSSTRRCSTGMDPLTKRDAPAFASQSSRYKPQCGAGEGPKSPQQGYILELQLLLSSDRRALCLAVVLRATPKLLIIEPAGVGSPLNPLLLKIRDGENDVDYAIARMSVVLETYNFIRINYPTSSHEVGADSYNFNKGAVAARALASPVGGRGSARVAMADPQLPAVLSALGRSLQALGLTECTPPGEVDALWRKLSEVPAVGSEQWASDGGLEDLAERCVGLSAGACWPEGDELTPPGTFAPEPCSGGPSADAVEVAAHGLAVLACGFGATTCGSDPLETLGRLAPQSAGRRSEGGVAGHAPRSADPWPFGQPAQLDALAPLMFCCLSRLGAAGPLVLCGQDRRLLRSLQALAAWTVSTLGRALGYGRLSSAVLWEWASRDAYWAVTVCQGVLSFRAPDVDGAEGGVLVPADLDLLQAAVLRALLGLSAPAVAFPEDSADSVRMVERDMALVRHRSELAVAVRRCQVMQWVLWACAREGGSTAAALAAFLAGLLQPGLECDPEWAAASDYRSGADLADHIRGAPSGELPRGFLQDCANVAHECPPAGSGGRKFLERCLSSVCGVRGPASEDGYALAALCIFAANARLDRDEGSPLVLELQGVTAPEVIVAHWSRWSGPVRTESLRFWADALLGASTAVLAPLPPTSQPGVPEDHAMAHMGAAAPRRRGGPLQALLQEVPDEFRCAIDGHLMMDPVSGPGGRVCDRGALAESLAERGVCPLTGSPASLSDFAREPETPADPWRVFAVADVVQDHRAVPLGAPNETMFQPQATGRAEAARGKAELLEACFPKVSRGSPVARRVAAREAPVARTRSWSWEEEAWRLERLFSGNGDFGIREEGPEAGRVVRLRHHCSDPDWQAINWAPEGLLLEAALGSAALRVLEPASLPQRFAGALPALFAEASAACPPRSSAVYRALQHIDRHMAALYLRAREADDRDAEALEEQKARDQAAEKQGEPDGQAEPEAGVPAFASAPGAGGGSACSSAPAAAAPAAPWSSEAQSLLEAAILEFRAEQDPKRRWMLIGQRVGRSARDCAERFRECRRQVLSRKSSAGPEADGEEDDGEPQASGLHLNLQKSVVIPLWEWPLDAAAQEWSNRMPEWSSMLVSHSGSYLGFQVGAGEDAWAAPVKKFRETVIAWAERGWGMCLTVLAYNTYILVKLMYVARLQGCFKDWPATEVLALQRLFPGPAGWLPSSIALCMQDELGMPTQLHSLTTAGGQQLRPPAVAAAAGPPARQAGQNLDAWDVEWRWAAWFRHGPAQRLLQAQEALARDGITANTVLEASLGATPRPVTAGRWRRARRTLQSTAARLLRQRLWLLKGHWGFRRKLKQWSLGPLEGRRVLVCKRVMKTLPKRLAPRIRASVLRTWLDGWCTARRLGSRGHACRLGCAAGEDCLRHYVRCPVPWEFGSRHLGLHDPGNSDGRAQAFLLWETGCSQERLVQLATLVAVAYQTHNILRHRCGGPLQVLREIRAQTGAGEL
ncbi:unnamed protein product [Prorocentrum cordatum]|uniref:U-box domain-containing protein n=1 Tax=Prorocentrum cordatum TaxID=2364126 RepID=A0ABN9UB21_9DINO|nr:unnamed protein product [Polarella glacialis]